MKIVLSGVQVSGIGNESRPVSKRDQYAKAFETQPGEILDLAMSSDRKLVAIAGTYDDVRVYRIADRKRVALISNVPAPIYSVALNADGTRLAIGSKRGEIQIYELPDGKLVKSLAPVPVALLSEAVTAQ